MQNEIPWTVGSEEALVRAIVHPFFVSKNKLKREAFLPPNKRNDVSVLRLHFTDHDFCKNHGKSLKIGDHKYVGLASIFTYGIREACNEPLEPFEDGRKPHVDAIATPLDVNLHLRASSDRIFTDDNGLPMHADVVYNFQPEEGEPIPAQIKILATRLKSIANFHPDPDIDSDVWTGATLC